MTCKTIYSYEYMIGKCIFLLNFRALPGRRRGGGGLGDTFTTTNAASFGLGGVFGGGKPRSAGIKIGGGTDPMLGK